MELTFRHGIIRHQIDTSGTATFLRKSGSNDEFIDLVCDEDSILFTIAHGVSANYLVTEPRTVTHAWGPMSAHGETQYLYWDISLLNATLSRGFTSVSPYTGPNEPTSPQIDLHWYDTNINQMKVWSGMKWIPKLRLFAGIYSNNAIVIPSPRGSQAGMTVPCKAGSIILGNSAQPVHDSDGTFLTSESNLIASHTSGENLKIEAIQLFGEAIEYIPAFYFVTYETPGKVKLASSNRPEEVINGIMTNEYFPGQVGNIIANGLVRNDQWDFLPAQVNALLYITAGGELTLTEPALQDKYVVGYVYDKTSIFVDIQWKGGIGQIQTVVGITLDGDVTGSGLSSSAINTTLSNSGVTAGTYNTLTVDAKGRAIVGANEPYLLTNEVITLSGDATGSGSTSIPVTLATVTTAGTYNSVTVDAKGRVISGSFVPAQNVAPLLVDFVNGASLDITGWNTKLLNFSSDFLGINYGLGTLANPGDVVLELRNTGVTPGNYNRVTVDAKGRVTSATFDVIDLSSTLTGDVTGSGSTTIATTLSDTGVTPGTYNTVDVDSKGRVTSASNTPYLTSVTLTGVVTGTGSNVINTSLTPTGVTPGTWNNFTVNAEGRLVGASNVDYGNDTTLTGDVLASGRGIISTSLSNTGVVAGTYNSVTVDAKGRVTAATIEPTSSAVTLTGDVTGTGTGTVATTLANTGVTPGTYNSVTVDAKGRVITASNTPDLVGATNLDELSDVTLTSPANTQVLQYNGSQWVNSTLSIPAGVQYLPDLLDVSVTAPSTNQSLLWTGAEWQNATLDRIVSNDSSIIVNDSVPNIVQRLNNEALITTTSSITSIGKSTPPEFWYALFDAGTIMQSNVEFHSTSIDADSAGNMVVGGYAKNVNGGASITNKAFVVKYDTLGTILWQIGLQGEATQSSPTSTPTVLEALVVDTSDNSIYVGLTSDAVSSIVKLDSTGNIVWQIKFDTYYGSISDIIVRASDNSIFASGYQDSNGRGYIAKINMTSGALDYFYELQRFRTYALELSSTGNELFVGGDLFDNPLDDNFANIFKFNVTGNSFTFVSNVTANLANGKRYVELKRSGTSIYALGSQPASSGSMGDYSIIKYNEATLAVQSSQQFYDAFFVRFVNAVGLSIDTSGNVYVLGYEGNTTPSSNNQLSLVKFNSSTLAIEWQKTFGNPSFGDRHYNLNGIIAKGNAVYVTGSTFDTYASSGLILKYPQDGSINGTFGTHVIANDNKFGGTPPHTIQSIVPSAITLLTPSTTSSVVSLAQSNVSHLSFISIGSGVDYSVNIIGQLQLSGNAGTSGQVLSSNGSSGLPTWNTLSIPSTLNSLSDVTIGNTYPLMASDVLTYHLGEWKNAQLPIATSMTTGVVKIGSGLSVDGSGLLTATGGAGATTLDGLTDVVITSPSTGQLLQYNGTEWSNTNNGGITLSQYSTDAAFAAIISRKARGTSSTPTSILANDRIFGLYANGYHSGGSFSPNSGAIQIIANENYTSTAQGNYITFETTKNATNVRLEQIRITDQGHLQFSQTSQRILGDFSNATHANRVAFQTSTVNGFTMIPIIPNGTSTNAGIFATNNSNTTNASNIYIQAMTTEARIASSRMGTGSFLPLTFYTSDIEQLRITTVGNLQFMGTSQRILGDFSNATHANRVAFQSSVTNNSTMIPIIPNGSNTTAGIFATNNASVTNSSFIQIAAFAAETRLASGTLGTGTFLPISFYTNNTEQVRIPATVSAVNYLTLQGSSTGQPLLIGAAGTDANVTIKLAPKGTGEVQVFAHNLAHNNGNFATYGDAITREYILRNSTSNATQTELFSNGTSTKITLANDSTCKFVIHIVARRTDADNESAAYVINGCIDRNGSAATTALVGTPTVTVMGEDIASWDVTVAADTINGGPRILVTGEAGKTIRWVAFVRTVEVIG